jgi:pyruvate/2-oxoacid:ferredoxin oxidoreductase alpha subunit
MCYPAAFIKEIQTLYKQGLKQKEIAEKLNCSLFTVKKAIKTDPEYEKVKQEKREKSKENHKLAKLKFKELEKQKQEEEERLWWGMIEQQKIHAQMISKKRKISIAQLVELSLSQYVEVGNKLRYTDPHHKPADLPKTYDVHNAILAQFKNYTDEIESEKWTSKVEEEALK